MHRARGPVPHQEALRNRGASLCRRPVEGAAARRQNPGAQPVHRAGGDAFVEELCNSRASDAKFHRRPGRDGGRTRQELAGASASRRRCCCARATRRSRSSRPSSSTRRWMIAAWSSRSPRRGAIPAQVGPGDVGQVAVRTHQVGVELGQVLVALDQELFGGFLQLRHATHPASPGRRAPPPAGSPCRKRPPPRAGARRRAWPGPFR